MKEQNKKERTCKRLLDMPICIDSIMVALLNECLNSVISLTSKKKGYLIFFPIKGREESGTSRLIMAPKKAMSSKVLTTNEGTVESLALLNVIPANTAAARST